MSAWLRPQLQRLLAKQCSAIVSLSATAQTLLQVSAVAVVAAEAAAEQQSRSSIRNPFQRCNVDEHKKEVLAEQSKQAEPGLQQKQADCEHQRTHAAIAKIATKRVLT